MIGTVMATGQSIFSVNPDATGFKLDPGQSYVATLPNGLSGRVWGRTDCKMMSLPNCQPAARGTPASRMVDCAAGCNSCSLVCSTGSCGADNGLAGLTQCGVVGGEPPATLAEFTLGTNGQDWYDISNVDGYNMGIGMTPIDGRYTKLGLKDSHYDCGGPQCNIVDDATVWCPPELQTKSGGKTYCLSICKAVTKQAHWAGVDAVTTYNTEKGPMTPKAYLQLMAASDDWKHPNHVSVGRQGKMVDSLCCSCGSGGGYCEQRNADGSFMQNPTLPCTYGCSPYNPSYPSSWWTRKAVAQTNAGTNGEQSPVSQLSPYPDWPSSTTGTHYAKIYSNYCPDSYSWQFNDAESTFMCKSGDYLFTFNPL